MFKFIKYKSDIDTKYNDGIDIDYDLIKKKQIALLIEDEIWIKLFSNLDEEDIQSLKKQLSELVSENKNVKKELSVKKNEKKKLIAKVLKLSDEVNNNNLTEGVDLLEQYQNDIYKINDEIDDLTFKSEVLPGQIREYNLELLKATIKYAYKDIIHTEKNLEKANKELDELRNRLRVVIKEKYDCEERRNQTYTFLHNVLGGKETDKLDKDILD